MGNSRATLGRGTLLEVGGKGSECGESMRGWKLPFQKKQGCGAVKDSTSRRFAKFSSRVEVELPQEGTPPPPESGCPKLLSPMSHSPTALSSDIVFSISLVPQFQFWGISPNVGI